MNKKLLILLTSKFKKDYKLAKKRHLDMQLLDDVIRKLSRGEQLEPQNNDHILTGNWSGYHECHIQPNWLQNSGKSPTACCGDESHKMLFTKIDKYYMLYINCIVLD